MRGTNKALQIFGGSGDIEEYPIVRFWRDVRLLTIGEWTSEIMRVVIVKYTAADQGAAYLAVRADLLERSAL